MRWIAHRGGAAGRAYGTPTRQSLERALSGGVDLVEIDVHATADSSLVVRHSPPVDRRGHRLTLAQLRLGDPAVLTLDEVVTVIAGRSRLLIDLKDPDAAAPLAAAILAAGTPERFVVCSPRATDLMTLRALAPRVELWVTLPDVGAGGTASVRRVAQALLSRGRGGEVRLLLRDVGRAVRDIVTDRQQGLAELGRMPWRDGLVADLPGLVAATGARGLSVHQWLVTPRLVTAAHELGVTVAAWTVNRPDALAAALTAGADYVTSDDVGHLRLHLGAAHVIADHHRRHLGAPAHSHLRRRPVGCRGVIRRLRERVAMEVAR